MSANRSEPPHPLAAADETATTARNELEALLRAESPRAPAAAAAVVLGRVVAVDAAGAVQVSFAGSERMRPARLALALPLEELAAAALNGRAVVLAFENGDPTLPLILGLMPQSDCAQGDAVAHQQGDPPAAGVMLQVDGRRVHISAQEEIVLQCGNASITLRRNGRVVIRGNYVETYSEGTNRIKGGQVRIN